MELLIVFLLAVGACAAAYLFLSRRATFLVSLQSKVTTARRADKVFLALVLAYILVFTSLAVLRYFTFHTGYLEESTSWDLGQYGQLIWNSLNGRLLQGTFVTDVDTFLGKSFTPILLAFVPLYAVWASPVVLLVTQTIGLGLGAFPVYWFARNQLGSSLALVIALAYLLSPGLENIGLTEFHEIALAVPLLAYATFFLLRRHDRGFLICLAVALLVKEEIALIAIIFGIYIFLIQRRRWFGLGLTLFGAAFAILLLQYLIPYFRGPGHGDAFYYFGEGAIGGGGSRYGYLGHSLPEILVTILTRPGIVWQNVVMPDKIEYVLQLLAPLGFLSLVGVEVFALALPTFAYSLLSTYGLQYSIRSYYFAPLLPFLFFGAVVGLRRLLDWGRQLHFADTAWKGSLATLLLVSSGAAYLLEAPGPLGQYFQSWRYAITTHALIGNQMMGLIPPGAVVVAQNEFLARLSNHQYLYEIPVIPDYRQADYLAADATPGSWYDVHKENWSHYLSTGYFEIVAQQDGYLIARRKPPDHPSQIKFGDVITFLGYSLPRTDTLRGGQTIHPTALWRADQPVTERYQVAVRVVDADGHLWAEEDREPDDGFSPTDQWLPGKPVGDQYTLRLPPTMPAGDYQIALAVHPISAATDIPAVDEQGRALGSEVTIATMQIEKDKGSHLASELWWIEQPLYVDMREIRFLGDTVPQKTLHPGQMFHVGLYWRARGKPQGDYVVDVELVDGAGRVALDQAARPAKNTYPTTEWVVGEVLLDWHDFSLPSDLTGGDYHIHVSLRDANTGQVIGETQISTIQVLP